VIATQVVALGAALASAATFGLSTSLQHLVTSRVTETRPDHLLARLLRTPLWVCGMSLSVVALTLHAVALSEGSLVLVQPVIVTGVVFAVLIRAALERGLPSRAELAWAAITWAGLATFLIGTGAPSPSRAVHPADHAGPAVAVLLILAATGAVLARGRPSRSTGKGLWLGAVSGVLFGLVAVLLKLVLDASATGLLSMVSAWSLWVMVGCGVCAVLVNQRAYQSTRLSVSMPLLNIVDVLVALVLASVVFGETPRLGGIALLVQAAGLIAMGLGVFRLARLEDGDLHLQPQCVHDALQAVPDPKPPALASPHPSGVP
jgi:hypothetical protein